MSNLILWDPLEKPGSSMEADIEEQEGEASVRGEDKDKASVRGEDTILVTAQKIDPLALTKTQVLKLHNHGHPGSQRLWYFISNILDKEDRSSEQAQKIKKLVEEVTENLEINRLLEDVGTHQELIDAYNAKEISRSQYIREMEKLKNKVEIVFYFIITHSITNL